MSQPRLWLSEVFDALVDLGGEAPLQQIYQRIIDRQIMDLAGKHWHETVRKVIEEHSSDSQYFWTRKKQPKDDLFFAPRGTRAGYWAIRKHLTLPAGDILSFKIEDETALERLEGEEKLFYTHRYERDLVLRVTAVALHGTICKGCGFDFEAVYGQRGSGYIEVHHFRPVSQLGKPTLVHAAHDMTVLCANCHRMVHRFHDQVLSLQELQDLIVTHRTTSL